MMDCWVLVSLYWAGQCSSIAGLENGRLADRRGLKSCCGFPKPLDNFGGSEDGRARSTYRHGKERRPSADGLVGEVDCIILGEEMRCPARTTIRRVKPVRARLAEAGPED